MDIPLYDIAEIKASSSKGGPLWINIETNKSKSYSLLPANPFDPRLLSHKNYDEAECCVGIIKALKGNIDPGFDENPYIRQSKRKDKPDYVNTKLGFPWDKNASPWKYYFEFVPANQDKTSLFVAQVWKLIIFGLLFWMVFGIFLAMYIQVTHSDRVAVEKIFVPTVPVAFGL